MAPAALQPVADETGLPLGLLRDLVQELLPEGPDGPQYRPAADTCTLAVLLVDEARDAGEVADLTLERLPDGTGALYPVPELSFVYSDDAWRQAMQHASTYVKQTLWRQDWDVRWRLARRDQQPLPPALEGGSLGAALALGLTKLAGGVKDLDLQGIAITATVDAQGRLDKIEGEFPKLLAAVRERTLPRIHTVVVAETQRQDVARIDASLLRDNPHADLRVICAETLKDVVRLLVVEAQTRWGECIDCRQELDRHPEVVGRVWLHEWVQAYVHSHASGYVLLTGGPGVGKSAFIAEQVRRGESPLVYHTIKRGMGNWDGPDAILRSLTAQLRRKYALPLTATEARMTPSAALFNTLQRVSSSLREGQKEVIYLDGLDEAFGPTGRFSQVVLPGLLPSHLPEGIVMVLTSRPGEHLQWLADPTTCITRDFAPTGQDNLEDIRTYLQQQNHARRLGLGERFLDRLVEVSKGYFAVAVLYFRDRPELQEELQAWQHDPARIPQGLTGWLTTQWERVLHPLPPARPTRRRSRGQPSEAAIKGVLGLLAMAREPLSRDHLMAFLTATDEHKGRRRRATQIGFLKLRELLRHLDPVLHLTQEFFDARAPAQGSAAPYRFFHTCFPEFITAQLSDTERQDCHRLLAQGCTAILDKRRPRPHAAVREYALRHRLAHLIAVQDWPEVVRAFADTDYVVERSERFIFADVYADALAAAQAASLTPAWRDAFMAWEQFLRWRIERLRLFPSAYAQEVHNEFIPTAPQRFTDVWSLWQKCLTSVPRLSLRKTFGLPILPDTGHRGSVYSVAWAPDGHAVVSGGADGTVKVWEAHTGRLLTDCIGHQYLVMSVAWAPDGHAVASGSEDGTVKVWDTQSGQCRTTLFFADKPFAVAFLPGQPFCLVVADRDGRLFGYELVR